MEVILPGAVADTGAPSKSRVIYVVSGSTGEYSDRTEWLTRAFETEINARVYVETLTLERQKLGERGYDWEHQRAVEAAMRALDPGFQEDYTGTHWRVEEVALESRDFEAAMRPVLPGEEI